ncbi:LysR family transcriptional regulator [Streptomyces kanamyceticus]|uniref:LysR family transcriptional regulator n=1 Tax=Streptomyces kanamyceticus TaxID=1967 RepID=UPI0037DC4FB2
MELRLLVTFEKVTTVLSFTRAATELKYAQSSVTSQILPQALGSARAGETPIWRPPSARSSSTGSAAASA